MTILNGIKLKGNETFTELLEIGKREKKTSLICKAKICNNILRPDWLSRIDKRYCKDCLD
jgi:hypothetical protein|tara:strand:- start:7 stop:186 length:180 start_codon:yes stop_codon:yes gene_type:complete